MPRSRQALPKYRAVQEAPSRSGVDDVHKADHESHHMAHTMLGLKTWKSAQLKESSGSST